MDTSNVTPISHRLRSSDPVAGASPLGKPDPASLAGIDIFRPLTPEQRRTVADLGHEYLLPGDYVLGVHGSVGESLYCLLEGSAELSVPTSKGYLGVRTVRGGESVPLSILFGEGRLITTAVTMDTVRAFAIPRPFLLRLCLTRPDIGVQVYRTAAELFGTRYGATLSKLIEATDGVASDAHLWAGA
ncbi:MAG: cyclic nucleotide-binding domain-containing protein [Chloroflexota bacterium]